MLYDWEPRSASTEAATGVIAGLSAKNRRTYWEVSAEGSQARQQWTTDFKATVNCNEEAAAAYWGSLSKRQKEFYITKYQCKAMEALTPLFKCMTDGVHRLEREEEQEEAEAESARKEAADETGLEAAPKQPKTKQEIARRARRLTIRLASMANRCFWLSQDELTVHILTEGGATASWNSASKSLLLSSSAANPCCSGGLPG